MEKQLIFSKKYLYLLFGIHVLLGLYLTSLYNYLLFHSLAELFSIVVACGIFMIAWNSRRFLDNNYLLLIGIAYLFVGGFDLIHILAYKGMNIFQGYETNLPTQLWISARYMESLPLLIAPLFLRRKLKVNLVYLMLQKINNSIELTIQDNGEGFDPREALAVDSSERGLGLTSMRERAELSGGSFSIESTPGKGTVIKAQWPI